MVKECFIPVQQPQHFATPLLSILPTIFFLAFTGKGKVNVNCTLVQALRFCTGRTVHRGSRGIALLFLDHGMRRGEGSASRLGCSLPPGNTRYPMYRRLVGPQGRSGQVRKISSPTEFDPRTVQPVASHYISYATQHTLYRYRDNIEIIIILAQTLQSCCLCIPSISVCTQYAEMLPLHSLQSQ